RRHNATCIDRDGLVAPAKEPLASAEELSALARITLFVPDPFFMGHLQSLQCVPDTMSRDMEMSCPLRLGPIRMGFHMTAQVFPIQLVRTARAGAFVGHAARLEPAVHAGLAHREPLSRLGFASTIAHKIHHPLTQI